MPLVGKIEVEGAEKGERGNHTHGKGGRYVTTMACPTDQPVSPMSNDLEHAAAALDALAAGHTPDPVTVLAAALAHASKPNVT